jgi:hypothetical protein
MFNIGVYFGFIITRWFYEYTRRSRISKWIPTSPFQTFKLEFLFYLFNCQSLTFNTFNLY